jgi:hypothetical protein
MQTPYVREHHEDREDGHEPAVQPPRGADREARELGVRQVERLLVLHRVLEVFLVIVIIVLLRVISLLLLVLFITKMVSYRQVIIFIVIIPIVRIVTPILFTVHIHMLTSVRQVVFSLVLVDTLIQFLLVQIKRLKPILKLLKTD